MLAEKVVSTGELMSISPVTVAVTVAVSGPALYARVTDGSNTIYRTMARRITAEKRPASFLEYIKFKLLINLLSVLESFLSINLRIFIHYTFSRNLIKGKLIGYLLLRWCRLLLGSRIRSTALVC
jgi:hypothetical protein